jgi:hypothetical protein
MKSIFMTAIAGSVFALTACQPASEMADKSPEMAKEIVGKCEFPNEKRDNYLLKQIEKGNDPKAIAEVRAAYEKRGAKPEESGSFNTYVSIVTGAPNASGPQQDANYKACLDQHR